MMTVKEVSRLTGVSVRTLQYYDRIGLLHPAEYTESGYRLYDDAALEILQQILLFRELEFPLKQISQIIHAPDFDRNRALEQQIDFINAGYLADGAPDEYPASQNKIGLTGEVAMVVCANYVASEVNNNTGTEINWGMFSYPEVEGGADPSNAYAGSNAIGITSYTENAQAAFDFAMFLVTGEYDQKMADTASQIPADPNNTAPAMLDGTIETLQATENPLTWNMGLNDNADLKTSLKDVIIGLYEGRYATGEEFAAAMDALY